VKRLLTVKKSAAWPVFITIYLGRGRKLKYAFELIILKWYLLLQYLF